MLLFLSLACFDIGDPVSEVPMSDRYSNLGFGGTPTTSTDTGSETVVLMRGLAFDPLVVNIAIGSTVTWVNEDTAFHILMQGEPGASTPDWESPAVQVGESWSRTFTEAGDFVYFCDNHERVMRDAFVHVE